MKVEPIDGLLQYDHESVLRIAGFKAAQYLVLKFARDAKVDEEEVFETASFIEAAAKYPKDIMQKYNIPTAQAAVFTEAAN